MVATPLSTPIAKRTSPMATPRAEATHARAKKAAPISAKQAASTPGTRAAKHLAAADARFEPLIKAHGELELAGIKDEPTAFAYLLKAIVHQQLASKAAAKIHGRVLAALQAEPPTPAAVLAAPLASLRSAGLSERKASYIVDLATHFGDGRLGDDMLSKASDEELREALLRVKGIGPTTCESFLIFQLGRPDVLPTGNLAVRKGLAKFLGSAEAPSADDMERLSRSWRPHRSFASYYLWKSACTK